MTVLLLATASATASGPTTAYVHDEAGNLTKIVDLTSDPANCGGLGHSCTPVPPNSQPVCQAGTCTFACNSGYQTCLAGCSSVTPPPTSYPGQCTADCQCGDAAHGEHCVLPAGQCIGMLVLNRSFTFSQVIPYNGAMYRTGLPPVTGGTFVDVPASTSSFSLSTSKTVQFALTFGYDPGSGVLTSSMVGATKNQLSARSPSVVLGNCLGIVAGPPQMVLQLRLVIDGVPDTSYLFLQTFGAGTGVFAISKALSAGSHTVAVQALQVYQCGNATPDGTLSGSPSVFTGNVTP